MGQQKSQVPSRRYTREFKHEAARLAESVGGSEASRRLGVPESSVWNWLKLRRAGKLAEPTTAQATTPRPASELEAELNRLRRENASLKLDNDLLKKAAAYFARESR
jgi:transposase